MVQPVFRPVVPAHWYCKRMAMMLLVKFLFCILIGEVLQYVLKLMFYLNIKKKLFLNY